MPACRQAGAEESQENFLIFFIVQESIPLRAQVKHFPNPARVYFPLPIKERYIPLRKSLKVIAEGDFLDL